MTAAFRASFVGMLGYRRPVPDFDRPTSVDRARLESLRYAVNDEAAQYIAIMRLFTAGTAGLLSDQSAAEVASRLAEIGLDLDVDTVDARLSYLVEHGNLARSPRETEARSVKEYLTNRARYQLTQRGELVHRQVEQLLASADAAREVSSEMLGGILEGLRGLARYDDAALAAAEPDVVAREIGTLFAQFERLVESTRDFYTYLSQVLVRYDLGRAEFQAFKTALLDYLQRFVDEVARNMPQIADELTDVLTRVEFIVGRANSGQRLVGIDGAEARRARGLDASDWAGLRAWFLGERGRRSDAEEVRALATQAMRALLVNLRRIASTGEREVSRYDDLLTLARWFDRADDVTSHALWAAAFGMYTCRHLGFPAGPDGSHPDPLPSTASWWRSPVADVPLALRLTGDRTIRGRSPKRADFSAAKAARLAEREVLERRRRAALAELFAFRGDLGRVKMSDDARGVLLDLYSRALADRDASGARDSFVDVPEVAATLQVRHEPGRSTVVVSPSGRLEMVDVILAVTDSRTGAAIAETSEVSA